VFFFAQEKLLLEPVSFACLSLVLPVYKLPSVQLDTGHQYHKILQVAYLNLFDSKYKLIY